MSKLTQISSILFFLLLSWCVMTFTHESGHLIGGWLGGATLVDSDLLPWHLPYSLHNPDPFPLLTLWSGPIWGILAPVAMWLIIRHWYVWGIACFCLLANGLYLGAGLISPDSYLDTTRLLKEGAWQSSIILLSVLSDR